MEFRRVEVVKVVREAKRLDAELSRKLFDKLMEQSLFFTIRAREFGPYRGCLVLSTSETEVSIRSKEPKARVTVAFSDVEFVEVESNVEVLHYSDSDGGRWENIQ
jgi:hypothetical protein